MATLQKFKLLATQCGVAQSPTRSPRTSPVVHLRRRNKTTLRMLLTRGSGRRSPPRQEPLPSIHQQKRIVAAPLPAERKRDTLKDLFISSFDDEEGGGGEEEQGKGFGGKCEVYRMKVNGLGGESGSPRPGWIGFRHRSLLRRAWRPMLVTIPETGVVTSDF